MPLPGVELLQQIGPAPAGFRGSSLEWLVANLLIRRGLRPGRPEGFVHQYAFAGGRLSRGGIIADFFLQDRKMVWFIQGIFYHYRTSALQAEAIFDAIELLKRGYIVVFIDEDGLLANPNFIISQALRGISHSRVRIL